LGHRIALELICEFSSGHIVLLASKITKQGVYKSRGYSSQEKLWAEEAKAQVEKLYSVGTVVKLEDVAFDAYSGRVLADVRRFVSDRWKYLAEEMIEHDMAMPWTPDMDKIEWCKLAKPI